MKQHSHCQKHWIVSMPRSCMEGTVSAPPTPKLANHHTNEECTCALGEQKWKAYKRLAWAAAMCTPADGATRGWQAVLTLGHILALDTLKQGLGNYWWGVQRGFHEGERMDLVTFKISFLSEILWACTLPLFNASSFYAFPSAFCSRPMNFTAESLFWEIEYENAWPNI